MLEHLDIKHFVVVDSLSLECQNGFIAITGETGAGKSVWVDALCLALGHRAEGQMIRTGHDRATITATFNITNNSDAQTWLANHDIENEDNQCILQRTLTTEGRSRATINGTPCPLNLIRDLAPLLIQIHSQQLQRSLLKADYQRQTVDSYAQNSDILYSINSVYERWLAVQSEIDVLNSKLPNREQQLELLTYQLNELEQLNLQTNEWNTLSEQHQKLHQAKHIKSSIQQALSLTSTHEEHAADSLIQQAQQHLSQLSFQDKSMDNIQTLLNTANIHLQEAIQELQQYYQSVDIPVDEIDSLDQRLSWIHELARKHHTTPEQLEAVHASLQHKVNELEHIDDTLCELNNTLNMITAEYHTLANTLTQRRQSAAKTLSKAMTAHMQTLAMEGGEFHISLQTDTNKISIHGHENIAFTVSTNPGSPKGAIQHVASGGELSRLSLALHILLADQQHTPTMIFDEVDTGISGKTASIVGSALKKLGEKTQVLCITHLPQVAALAQHHYVVSKQKDSSNTTASISSLNKKQRIDEIARLMGGKSITQATKVGAEELLDISI